MKVDTFACDNCQKQRSDDTNHWWQLRENTDKDGVMIEKFYERNSVNDHLDACGQECAIAMLQRYLATGSFTRKSVVLTEAR